MHSSIYLQKTCGLEILVSSDPGNICFVLQQVLGCSTTWSMDSVLYHGCVGLCEYMNVNFCLVLRSCLFYHLVSLLLRSLHFYYN